MTAAGRCSCAVGPVASGGGEHEPTCRRQQDVGLEPGDLVAGPGQGTDTTTVSDPRRPDQSVVAGDQSGGRSSAAHESGAGRTVTWVVVPPHRLDVGADVEVELRCVQWIPGLEFWHPAGAWFRDGADAGPSA